MLEPRRILTDSQLGALRDAESDRVSGARVRPAADLRFLIQLGLVQSDPSGRLRVTDAGVRYLEYLDRPDSQLKDS